MRELQEEQRKKKLEELKQHVRFFIAIKNVSFSSNLYILQKNLLWDFSEILSSTFIYKPILITIHMEDSIMKT